MALKIVSANVKANGEVQLPKPVQQALAIAGKGGTVGFIVERSRVSLTKVKIIPDRNLSDEDIALLAQCSRGRVGRRTFRTKEATLQHLWSL